MGKSLRPHFRHDAGQQKDSCLVKTSQIVALQLLFQEKVIHLPEQTSRWTVGGASGQIYTGIATSAGFSARIATREWVDVHEAKITLDDGRVVWLRLSGTCGRGLESSGDAVITIKVDDPEVSTWPAEKILEHAQLTGHWLCWEKHFDDDQLAQQARLDAEQQAHHWCDYIPQDMDLPEGLTDAQRSEGVLHWLIKGILANAPTIATPTYNELITRNMPNQTFESRRVYLDEKTYRISNVRLENRLQGVIPDVICTATADGEAPMELMIEVAVTHKVDQVKTARIRSMGIACLEIDTQRMGKGGRTTVDELRAMVLTHTNNKSWVFHPSVELLRRAAKEQLEQRHAQVVKEVAEERARSDWLKTMAAESLLQEYVGLLRQVWAGETPRDSRGLLCWPSDLIPALEQLGFREMDALAIINPRGLLWALEAIANNTQESGAFKLFEEAMKGYGPERLTSFVTVLGAAIVMFETPMTPREVERLQAMREIIKQSIHKGDLIYARTAQYDHALSILYPRLRDRLQSSKGTQEVVKKVWLERKKKQREQAQQVAEAYRKAQTSQEQQDELLARLNEVTANYEWLPKAGWPHDLPTTILHVIESIGKGAFFQEIDRKNMLGTAWQAREDGQTLRQWLRSEDVKSVSDVNVRLKLLDTAWMLNKKKSLLISG